MNTTHAEPTLRGRQSARPLICVALFFSILVAPSRANRGVPQNAVAPFVATIVLPPTLVAGHPATLAALDSEGKLLSGVTIEVGAPSGLGGQRQEIQRVTTDATGRALFTASTQAAIVIARAGGVSAAALVGPSAVSSGNRDLQVAPVISQRDRFSIRGGEFHGDAESDRVQINGDPALVLAASPTCLVVLPGANARPGPVNITIQSAAARWNAATTLVALTVDATNPPLAPLKKSSFTVRVQGSDQPLAIVVGNKSPGVLRFRRGDVQYLKTTGGVSNVASVQLQAMRSGDFTFQARLVPPADLAAAQRYLSAAAQLAARDERGKILSLGDRLVHHPNDAVKVKDELDRMLVSMPQGDSRTLLEAARARIE